MHILRFHYVQSSIIFALKKKNCVRFYLSPSNLIGNSMSNRDLNHVQNVRKSLKKKTNTNNEIPASVTIRILGSGAYGVPGCLYVSTDHSRYLFNCGEGTQRLAHEHHLRLSKLEHIFFTSPTWANMGGLPGLALTVQDMGVRKVDLHGPTGITGIFDAVKRFVLLDNLTINEAQSNSDDVYVDNCMQIKYVHLQKLTSENDFEEDEHINDTNTDYYAHEVNCNGKRRAQNLNFAEKILKTTDKRPTSYKVKGCIAYICKLHAKPGNLNLSKCVDLGITPGPLLGQLKAGKDITLADGTIVKGKDVCDGPEPGPVFIVVECPNEDYLDSLLNNEAFNEYGKDADKKENIASFIFHFTPDKVLNSRQYIEWMSRFGTDTQHIIINQGNSCFNFEAIHRIQHQLNLLHPTIFPMIHDKYSAIDNNQRSNSLDSMHNLKIHRAQTFNAIHLRPYDGLDTSSIIKTNNKAAIDEVLNIEGFTDTSNELQTEIDVRSKFINESPRYPKIVMLGTGSSVPNKVRNVSAILMCIDKDTSVLMDCGEGTIGQMIRFFGVSDIDRVLASIKAIYVSHLHADHHLGLFGVLQNRKYVTDEPIFLLAPKQIESWLTLYHNKFEHINDTYVLVPNQCLVHDNRKVADEAYSELKEKLKINNVCTTPVYHCSHSFGVAWHLACGKQIVYSGDTKPCPNLVEIGHFCDLLIHEATMEDELEEEAKKKMHSTMSQALMIAKQMEAKFTLLTHFSQRYSKMPRLPSDENILSNVGIAFDNMQFSIAELSLLPLFYPSLRLIFSEFCNTLEEKAQRRHTQAKLRNK